MTLLTFALLALGAFRLTRLAGWDDVTHPARRALLGVTDDGRPVRGRTARWRLAAWAHCPWCVGFWISVAVYAAWRVAPAATLVAMTPLAISALVGLIAKNLDP